MKLTINFRNGKTVEYYNVKVMNKNSDTDLILFITNTGIDIFYDINKKTVSTYDNFMSTLYNKCDYRYPSLVYKNVESLSLLD